MADGYPARGAENVMISAKILFVNGEKSVKIATPFRDEWVGFAAIHPDDRIVVKRGHKGETVNFRIPRWLAEKFDLIGG